MLTTKEFIKEVQKLGFETLENTESISILYGCGKVACVYKNEIFSVGTDYIPFDNLSKELKEKLYNLIDKYARTPLDEREEPEKFYLKINMMTRNRCDYLNYYKEEDILMLDVRLETYYAQTQFTQKEIDEMKVKFGLTLSDFEQIPVEDKEQQ